MHEHIDGHPPAPLSDTQACAREARREAREAHLHAVQARERATVTRARTAELLERAKARLAAAHETLDQHGRRRDAEPAPRTAAVPIGQIPATGWIGRHRPARTP
ncbi:hypothetical protein Ade02nite_40290 [Paractinoplanes deccanensis]|uniref:Uncharacterized protein n=1 Tax=Paractinoplanes deccanensis TaxID=113561 RepID=A0ABQ3Y5Y1_9ACTN|nr:hypothetical protein [Actinoplanes deccanensis]GID75388.1 hypothetical protein Ade02nite_40290 [Actinoplanes deccanensis]